MLLILTKYKVDSLPVHFFYCEEAGGDLQSIFFTAADWLYAIEKGQQRRSSKVWNLEVLDH